MKQFGDGSIRSPREYSGRAYRVLLPSAAPGDLPPCIRPATDTASRHGIGTRPWGMAVQVREEDDVLADMPGNGEQFIPRGDIALSFGEREVVLGSGGGHSNGMPAGPMLRRLEQADRPRPLAHHARAKTGPWIRSSSFCMRPTERWQQAASIPFPNCICEFAIQRSPRTFSIVGIVFQDFSSHSDIVKRYALKFGWVVDRVRGERMVGELCSIQDQNKLVKTTRVVTIM